MGMKPGYVYIVGTLEGCCKIGHSSGPDRRLRSYSPLLPVDIKVIHQIESFNRAWLEKYLHWRFANCRVRGEWFRLSAQDLVYLKTISVADTPYDLPDSEIDDALKHAEQYFGDPVDDCEKWSKSTFICLNEQQHGISAIARLHRWTGTLFTYSLGHMIKHDVSRVVRRNLYRNEMAAACRDPLIIQLEASRWLQHFSYNEAASHIASLDVSDSYKYAAMRTIKALSGSAKVDKPTTATLKPVRVCWVELPGDVAYEVDDDGTVTINEAIPFLRSIKDNYNAITLYLAQIVSTVIASDEHRGSLFQGHTPVEKIPEICSRLLHGAQLQKLENMASQN